MKMFKRDEAGSRGDAYNFNKLVDGLSSPTWTGLRYSLTVRTPETRSSREVEVVLWSVLPMRGRREGIRVRGEIKR